MSLTQRFIVGLIAAFAIAAPVGVAPVFSHEYANATIRVDHPWARATAPRATTGAIYMTLSIDGDKADRLIGAETSVAEKVELHSHSEENGIVRMRPVAAIEVAPGSPTKIAPGGLHLMLIGLKKPLVEEAFFPLTLIFEHAGRIEIEVYVEGGGETSPHHVGQ
jgi:copper(I)-binding protein